MSYLVIAYPKIDRSDYVWIQKVRKEHDVRYYNVVEPHVTLVFSSDKLSFSDFKQHVLTQVANTPSFSINLNTAKLVLDDSGELVHAFLVPSDGFDEINALHDALYTGPLESELRHDIPFIPHVGIGSNENEHVIEELTTDINASGKQITGTINELTIVEYNGRKVVDLEAVPLNS